MTYHGNPNNTFELQVFSNFSFLEGASHPDELAATIKTVGRRGFALTDINSLAGVVRAHAAARQLEVPFRIGCTLRMEGAPDILCFPRNRAAYARLCHIISRGRQRAKKGACKMYFSDVVEFSEDQILVVTAGGPYLQCSGSVESRDHGEQPPSTSGGEKPLWSSLRNVRDMTQRVMNETAAEVYLALCPEFDGHDDARFNQLNHIANECRVKLVATNRVRFHSPHRKRLQDVITCIREKCRIQDAGFLLQAHAESYIKTPQEVQRVFADFPEALENANQLAEDCNFSIDELIYEYPEEPVPEGETPDTHLEKVTFAGAANRYPDGIPDDVRNRVNEELAIIRELEYAPYFLTVFDIVSFARRRDILCQGRGSAANSSVCYCLGITNVNPMQINLLFERFMTPERREPPDIDVDFEHDRREEVIQYIYQRYGRHRAGLAATVISYRGRSAVRDVGKVMGLSEDVISSLAGMVWGSRSSDALPASHVREAGLNPDDPLIATTLELTRELIGFPRHLSQHVGGFVLTRSALDSVVPIQNAVMEDRTVIEWDKDDLEAAGLLKVDVLGLGMLTCLHRGFDLLAKDYDYALTLASVPREDAVVYDMLCRADSVGVFQVESRAQMNMLPRLKPRCFYDLVIEVAIVRPGPIQGDMVHPYLRRRDGLEPEVYPAPASGVGPPDELESILKKTRGVPLFQEQAMRIAMVAAEFSAEEVNELRRAMATFRRVGTIGRLEEKMVNAMIRRGYEPEFASRCFDQIKGFGEYGFPESHAASFAHLVYVSSWMKCRYPEVFACALLNSQPMGFYAPAQLVRDAREHGVEVRPPDVNDSEWDSTLELLNSPDDSPTQPGPDMTRSSHASRLYPANGQRVRKGQITRPFALRLGLRNVDGLSETDARKLLDHRKRTQRSRAPGSTTPIYASIAQIRHETGISVSGLERLAAADAMRSLKQDRRAALWDVKALPKAAALPLFSWSGNPEAETPPGEFFKLPDMPLSEHVVNDYQTLKLSLKAHPMSFFRDQLTAAGIMSCEALNNSRNGLRTKLSGVVLVRQKPGSAKGVVFMTLEDETGVANAVIWPNVLEANRRVIMGARLVEIEGRVQRHENIVHLVVDRIFDRTDRLHELTEGCTPRRKAGSRAQPRAKNATVAPPLAHADEVARPVESQAAGKRSQARIKTNARSTDRNGSATEAPAQPDLLTALSKTPDNQTTPELAKKKAIRRAGWAPGRHPRTERVIPKSRDFH